MRGQVIAVLSGGDWTDADVAHLVALEDCDLEQAWLEYRVWYTESPASTYYSFSEWLVKQGHAREATGDDVIEVEGVGYR